MIKGLSMRCMVLISTFSFFISSSFGSTPPKVFHQNVSLTSCGGLATLRPSGFSLLSLDSVENCTHVIDEMSKTQTKLTEKSGLGFMSLYLSKLESMNIQVRSQSGYYRDFLDLSVLNSSKPVALLKCGGNARLIPLIEVSILNPKRCNRLVVSDTLDSSGVLYHEVSAKAEKYIVPAIGSEPSVLLRSELGDYQDSISLQFSCFNEAMNMAKHDAQSRFIQSISGSFVSQIGDEITYRFLIKFSWLSRQSDREVDVIIDRSSCSVIAMPKVDSTL